MGARGGLEGEQIKEKKSRIPDKGRERRRRGRIDRGERNERSRRSRSRSRVRETYHSGRSPGIFIIFPVPE